jgi:hypothetical protein
MDVIACCNKGKKDLINTWMKWNIFGEEYARPVYVFVVGDMAIEPAPILCTTASGYSFYVSQRFVDRLIPCTEEEQVRLAGHITQAVILDNNEQPRLLDEGKRLSPTVAYSYAEHFYRKEGN